MSTESRIRRAFDRLPRWVRAVIAVATVVLGAVLITRPTTSLGVLALLFGAGLVLTGVLGLVGGEDERPLLVRVIPAVVWILGGLFVLLWPGLTVRGVALVVGIGLIVNGLLTLLTAFGGSRTLDERIASGLLGASGVIFGILALTWPDISLLIVGVVFGAWLVISGVSELVRALRGRRATKPRRREATVWSRWVRTIGAVAAIVVAVAAAAVSVSIRGASPVVDEFYAAPRDVPAEPGQLIRYEPFTRTIPDDALAWRMLYTTTNADGSPAIASGLVVVPADGPGDWPVIDWNHGTTGFDQSCAPTIVPEVLESGAFMILPEVLEEGWALVATDYIGLGTEGPHPYLIGEPTARASLDAVRAARDLPEARLGEQTVVWGHSQGGGAALWTGALAESYAEDVPLSGVAALAPASNLPGMVGNLGTLPGGSIFASYVIAAYTALYDDVTFREYVRPGAEVTVRQLAARCLAAPGIVPSLVDVIGTSNDPEVFSKDPTTGALGERLVENIPPATIGAPLLLAQGTVDSIVVPAAQDDFVEGLCAEGQQVDYRTFEGRDHVPLVEPDSPLIPQLFEWTRDRFAGEPVDDGCVRTDF